MPSGRSGMSELAELLRAYTDVSALESIALTAAMLLTLAENQVTLAPFQRKAEPFRNS